MVTQTALLVCRISIANRQTRSLLLGFLGLEVPAEVFDAPLELDLLLTQLGVLGLERVDVGVGRGAKGLLDKGDGVAGLLRLFVEADEHLGQLVDHAGALEILSIFLLLLLRGLDAHFIFDLNLLL